MAITKITTVEVGSGGAASIDFTSIPGTYTDLMVVLSTRVSTSAVAQSSSIKFNGVSTNFLRRSLFGAGSAAYSTSASTSFFGYITANNATSNTFANASIYIPNYAGSTTKSWSADVVTENNGTEAYQLINAGIWFETSAITSVSLVPDSGTWLEYSSATLYGVLKGSSGGVTVS